MSFETLKAELRGILLADVNGVLLTNVSREYEGTYGKRMNFSEFGYSDVLSLIESIPDVARVMKDQSGRVVVRGIALNNMNIIANKAAHHVLNPVTKNKNPVISSTSDRQQEQNKKHRGSMEPANIFVKHDLYNLTNENSEKKLFFNDNNLPSDAGAASIMMRGKNSKDAKNDTGTCPKNYNSKVKMSNKPMTHDANYNNLNNQIHNRFSNNNNKFGKLNKNFDNILQNKNNNIKNNSIYNENSQQNSSSNTRAGKMAQDGGSENREDLGNDRVQSFDVRKIKNLHLNENQNATTAPVQPFYKCDYFSDNASLLGRYNDYNDSPQEHSDQSKYRSQVSDTNINHSNEHNFNNNNFKNPVRNKKINYNINTNKNIQNIKTGTEYKDNNSKSGAPKVMSRENLCLMYHDLFVNVPDSNMGGDSSGDYYKGVICGLRELGRQLPEVLEVIITHFEVDSSFFWAIIITPKYLSGDLLLDFDNCEQELEDFSFKSRRGLVRHGSYYCRVWVKSVSGDTAVVHMVDFGHTEVLPLEKIKNTPARLWKHPPSAVPFQLIGGQGLNPATSLNKRHLCWTCDPQRYVPSQEHIFHVKEVKTIER